MPRRNPEGPTPLPSSTLKVGHLTVLARPFTASEEAGAGKFLNGWWELDRGEIAVRAIPNPDLYREIVLHECLHAIIDAFRVPIGGDAEENVVTTLAPALLTFLRDNPEFVRWLLANR